MNSLPSTAKKANVENVEPTRGEEKKTVVSFDNVTLTVPMREENLSGYCKKHFTFEFNELQARSIQRIQLGLSSSGATLTNKRPVTTVQDAFRWIAEQADRLQIEI